MYSGKIAVQISDTIPIYDTNNILYGYSISFTSNNKPDGFVVFAYDGKNNKNPVIEFSLKGKVIYSRIEDSAKSTSNVVIDESTSRKLIKRLYYTKPFEYGVDMSTNKGTYVWDTDGTFVPKNKFKSTHPVTSHISFWDAFYGFQISGTINNYNELLGADTFTPVIMNAMPSYSNDGKTAGEDKEGNCGPTALTNVIKYYHDVLGFSGLINTNISDTYKQLSSLSGYTPANGTSPSKEGYALSMYCLPRMYACTVGNDIGYNWSNITAAIDKQEPVLVNAYGYDSETSDQIDGHAIVAVGYLSTTDQSEYLQIVDEWDQTADVCCRFGNGTGFINMICYPVSISL